MPAALLPAVFRRLPFTVALALTILVTAAITGTLTKSITPDQLAAWGFGADDLAGGRWLQLARSTLQIFNPSMGISMLATVLALVGACEYRLGTTPTVLVFALSHVAGSLAVITVTKAFAARGSAWGLLLASQQGVGASAGSIGALGAWLVFFPSRQSLVLISICSLFLIGAFAGQAHPWDVAHVAAFVAGLASGAFIRRRRSGGMVSTRDDRRNAVAWCAVIVGLAAVLAPFVATDALPLFGIRSRYGERGLDVVRWWFLISGVVSWICVPLLRRGERRAWPVALAVAVGMCVGLWQPGAPGVDHVVAILLLATLAGWRRDFGEPPAPASGNPWQSAALIMSSCLAFVALGFIALRWQLAPPLGTEGSLAMVWSRLSFQPIRTPNWDSAGAHWFLTAVPVALYGALLAAMITLWVGIFPRPSHVPLAGARNRTKLVGRTTKRM